MARACRTESREAQATQLPPREGQGWAERGLTLVGEAHWLKPPTLARHHSNYLHELFYDRSS